MLCTCPNTGALTTSPSSDCEINLKQIQKLIFFKQGQSMTVATEDPTLAATWATRIAAANDTKVVATPFIEGDSVIEAGDPTTEGGGDNSTLNGVEEVTGSDPSKYSGKFKGISPAQEKAMKSWICNKKLVVALVNQDNQIIMRDVVGDGTILDGFPIQSFFITDRNNAGFNSRDTNEIQFSMAAGWSEGISLVAPEAGFSPLVDIV